MPDFFGWLMFMPAVQFVERFDLEQVSVDSEIATLTHLGACLRMPFCPNSSLFQKNNARNIIHMAVLIFFKFLDFEQNTYSRTNS